MKILHCADIHLDSAMKTNFDYDKAIKRRHELLITFIKMNEYAAHHQVELILIAGDLFDTEYVTENTRQQVMAAVANNNNIQYVYIEGNHDEGNALGNINKNSMPDNFHVLNCGERFRYKNVSVMTAKSPKDITFSKDGFNILMLHGEPDIDEYAGKNIDYMALGHIHTYQCRSMDERGVACYSGCLEGRGFDETGEKGFLIIDTQKSKKPQFVPFGLRKFFNYEVNISGCETTNDIINAIESGLSESDITCKDIVRVNLTGRVDATLNVRKRYIESVFEDRYFAFNIDESGLKNSIDIDKYQNDISLKGEFIRNVLSSDETEKEKRMIIELGLSVLSGEEPQ